MSYLAEEFKWELQYFFPTFFERRNAWCYTNPMEYKKKCCCWVSQVCAVSILLRIEGGNMFKRSKHPRHLPLFFFNIIHPFPTFSYTITRDMPKRWMQVHHLLILQPLHKGERGKRNATYLLVYHGRVICMSGKPSIRPDFLVGWVRPIHLGYSTYVDTIHMKETKRDGSHDLL